MRRPVVRGNLAARRRGPSGFLLEEGAIQEPPRNPNPVANVHDQEHNADGLPTEGDSIAHAGPEPNYEGRQLRGNFLNPKLVDGHHRVATRADGGQGRSRDCEEHDPAQKENEDVLQDLHGVPPSGLSTDGAHLRSE